MKDIELQIISIGGGGFGRNPNFPIIEQYILNQSKIKSPNICFIPTASAEDKSYIVNFYKAFSKFDCTPTHLNLFEFITFASKVLADLTLAISCVLECFSCYEGRHKETQTSNYLCNLLNICISISLAISIT